MKVQKEQAGRKVQGNYTGRGWGKESTSGLGDESTQGLGKESTRGLIDILRLN